MNKETNILSNRTKSAKHRIKPDGISRASKYNYTIMNDETLFAEQQFPKRLLELRTRLNVSAREMSLSLGQSAGYINNIENGSNLPSMAMFFEICEFLGVSPYDFFRYTIQESDSEDSLSKVLEKLSNEDKELLIQLANALSRKE